MKHPFYLLLASIGLLIFSCDEKIKKGIHPTQENQSVPENIDPPKIEKTIPNSEENSPNKAKKNKIKSAPLDTLRPKTA